jgi:hypothetical protein
MIRAAASGKRVWLRLIDDIHARHRQLGALRQVSHHGVEMPPADGVDFARTVHRNHCAIGIPLGEQTHGGATHTKPRNDSSKKIEILTRFPNAESSLHAPGEDALTRSKCG